MTEAVVVVGDAGVVLVALAGVEVLVGAPAASPGHMDSGKHQPGKDRMAVMGKALAR